MLGESFSLIVIYVFSVFVWFSIIFCNRFFLNAFLQLCVMQVIVSWLHYRNTAVYNRLPVKIVNHQLSLTLYEVWHFVHMCRIQSKVETQTQYTINQKKVSTLKYTKNKFIYGYIIIIFLVLGRGLMHSDATPIQNNLQTNNNDRLIRRIRQESN